MLNCNIFWYIEHRHKIYLDISSFCGILGGILHKINNQYPSLVHLTHCRFDLSQPSPSRDRQFLVVIIQRYLWYQHVDMPLRSQWETSLATSGHLSWHPIFGHEMLWLRRNNGTKSKCAIGLQWISIGIITLIWRDTMDFFYISRQGEFTHRHVEICRLNCNPWWIFEYIFVIHIQ